MKSTRSAFIRLRLRPVGVRRVAMVEHEPVAVRVLEERHVADARVIDLRELELDAAALESIHRRLDVRHAEGNAELGPIVAAALLLGRAQDESDVVRLEFWPLVAREGIPPQAQRAAVELRGSSAVPDAHADEIGALHFLSGHVKAVEGRVAVVELKAVSVGIGARRAVTYAGA